MYLASSHIVGDSPFFQAQPHCNSVETQKTITRIFTAVNLKQWQWWWVVLNLPTSRNTMNITEKAVKLLPIHMKTDATTHHSACFPGVPIFLRHNTYISSLLCRPQSHVHLQNFLIPYQEISKQCSLNSFSPNLVTKIKKVQLTDLDDIYEVHFLFVFIN
jgi:hypothetical protein